MLSAEHRSASGAEPVALELANSESVRDATSLAFLECHLLESSDFVFQVLNVATGEGLEQDLVNDGSEVMKGANRGKRRAFAIETIGDGVTRRLQFPVQSLSARPCLVDAFHRTWFVFQFLL